MSDQGEFELVHYDSGDFVTDCTLDTVNQTLWATQAQIAGMFGIDRTVVTKHLKATFDEGELEEDRVCASFAHTAADGKTYQVKHYNLDAILSVGYRVSSRKATAFRRWATSVLHGYIIQGFALNEGRLRNDANALRELAAQVRALRSGEKQIYAAVRDVFKIGSSDYDKDAPETRSFYAGLQDKFMFAITGNTASQIVLERANHESPNMGLVTLAGARPTGGDVTIGKNYLENDELYALHILCEQFLLFVESRAIRGQTLSMGEMSQKFDELLKVQGHAVFSGYKDYLKDRAVKHAKSELDSYRRRMKDLTVS